MGDLMQEAAIPFVSLKASIQALNLMQAATDSQGRGSNLGVS